MFSEREVGARYLQAPTLTKQGTLPDKVAVFVALYCLSGIPIFAMALGKVHSIHLTSTAIPLKI